MLFNMISFYLFVTKNFIRNGDNVDEFKLFFFKFVCFFNVPVTFIEHLLLKNKTHTSIIKH